MNDAENLPSDFEKKVKFFAVFCGVCFAIVAVLVGAISFMIGGEQRAFKKQVAPLFQGFNALTDEAISFSYEMNTPAEIQIKYKVFKIRADDLKAEVAKLEAPTPQLDRFKRQFFGATIRLLEYSNAQIDKAGYELEDAKVVQALDQIKQKGGQPLPLKGMAVDEMVLDKYNRSMTTINKITQEELNKKRDGFYKEAKEFLFDYAGMMGVKKQTLLENATEKQS